MWDSFSPPAPSPPRPRSPSLRPSPRPHPPPPPTTLALPHLNAPVEIIRDRWGINHIYAETEYDLFFAQGYAAARDRLFQFEVWRAQATGTVAAMLGPDELQRDIGFRLFRYRGDMTAEMNQYHDRGSVIIPAYVDGVNAYIAETEANPELLPIQFGLLGIRPKRWTPEVVISRHQGLLGNIGSELNYGRAVAALGDEAVKRVANFHPGDPDISLDPAIDGALLRQDILRLYNAFRGSVRFRPEHLVPEHRGDTEAFGRLASAMRDVPGATARPDPAEGSAQAVSGRSADANGWPDPLTLPDLESLGSNNWVVSGRLSESGYPPHGQRPPPGPVGTVAALLGAPGGARLECDRRRGARNPRGEHRPQRVRRLGPDCLPHRRRGTCTSTRPTRTTPTPTAIATVGRR